MKRKGKQLVALGLAATMAMSLAACGNSAGNDTSSSAPVESSSVAESTPATDSAPVEEVTEETYDFGGVTVKVFGSDWDKLKEENLPNEPVAQEAKAFVEEKYNIVLEPAAMEGYDGTNDDDILISSIAAGAPAADIICLNPESMITMFTNELLVDISDYLDELQVGSIYTDAGTWQGHVYGVSFSDLGSTRAIVYDRSYLEEIGMEKTPTEMFMEGNWDYESFRNYLADMKSKLPDGVYPIGCYPYHWAYLAAGANGTVLCGDDGQLNLTDEAVIEAVEFYQQLEEDGLAYPGIVVRDADGAAIADQTDYAYSSDDERIVLKIAEEWQFGGLPFDEFGITYLPWGSNVTCEGDYTTLSDNYYTVESYWGLDSIVAKSVETTGIPADVLLKIMWDYRNAVSDKSWMHNAYVNEQAGDFTTYGASFGQPRNFYTEEDIELYDWGHSRLRLDFSWGIDSADLARTWRPFMDVIYGYEDARSTLQSYYNEALANLEAAGLTQN